ncbi:MAG: carbamoyltransferase HypF [Candidatus Thorarchaeota archaeon]
MSVRGEIHVSGIVQGVGFRPFIYRIATALSLKGYVLNLGDAGVRIVVEGKKGDIQRLIQEIKNNPPSIAQIEKLEVAWFPTQNAFTDFSIRASTATRKPGSAPDIPPDIAICDLCIDDILSPESRWYDYPFTSCAACGPRFTTITSLPYDRPNTTMIDFPLCDTCNTGYTNPTDRRYHAQTTACPICGPQYTLLDSHGVHINTANPVARAARYLLNNLVVAVHGIGGTHLVTITTNPEAIKILRERKRRPSQPFAIMAQSLEAARQIVSVSPSEASLLTSWRRPIVLLKKRTTHNIPEESVDLLSPGLDTIGVMLPYSGVHILLFRYTGEPALVMTSANPSGVPMYIKPDLIVSRLTGIADYFLVHNRRIAQRVDDSVVKPINNHFVFIRRARGYVPNPIPLVGIHKKSTAIAVGPEERVTGAIIKSGNLYLTQHIGNARNPNSIIFLHDALNHLRHLVNLKMVDTVACDLHPDFASTELAEQLAQQLHIPLHRVQHHHAHLVSLLIDAGIDVHTRIVCITADGYGFGADGNAWGGEVLIGDAVSYRRAGGLSTFKLIGGDLSAKFAARPLIGILSPGHLEEVEDSLIDAPVGPSTRLSKGQLKLMMSALQREVNVVRSSSAGRVLDAIAFLLDVCRVNSYSGECPMRLEAIAQPTSLEISPAIIREGEHLTLDVQQLVLDVLELNRKGHPRGEIAYAAQRSIGQGLGQIAVQIADTEGIEFVGFSGGVALNRVITRAVLDEIRTANLQPLLHSRIPPGDGGVSAGQAAAAALHWTEYRSTEG